MKQVTAINPKHQNRVNRFVIANNNYDTAVDAGASERATERLYERAQHIWSELPKRERANLSKNIEGLYYHD